MHGNCAICDETAGLYGFLAAAGASKTFSTPAAHTHVRVSMRLTYEGSWDYENIYISADGVNVYESENIKTTSTGANALCTTGWTMWADQPAVRCYQGGAYYTYENCHRYVSVDFAHTASTLTIAVTSDTNENCHTESFAFSPSHSTPTPTARRVRAAPRRLCRRRPPRRRRRRRRSRRRGRRRSRRRGRRRSRRCSRRRSRRRGRRRSRRRSRRRNQRCSHRRSRRRRADADCGRAGLDWHLILRHHTSDGYFADRGGAQLSGDSSSGLYSRLANLRECVRRLRAADAQARWPTLTGVDNYNVWRQASNPLETDDTGTIQGYEAVDVNWSIGADDAGEPIEFRGLYKSDKWDTRTYLDGIPNGCWYFAVGQYEELFGGLPGPIGTGDMCDATGYVYETTTAEHDTCFTSTTMCAFTVDAVELYVLADWEPTSAPTQALLLRRHPRRRLVLVASLCTRFD